MTPTISFSGTENEMIVTAAELPKRLLRFSTLSKGKFSDSTDAAIIQAHPLFKGDVGFSHPVEPVFQLLAANG